jgi:sulfite reductase (NADPH) flavoprotein alpha-component
MNNNLIPCLPESAPFSPEQRAYLNGFLAGLFSRTAAPDAAATPAPAAKPLQSLTVLFGSQTGNAEGLARRVSKEAGKCGFAPTIYDLAQYPHENLKSDQRILLISSTYGDGEPPDNAKSFWDFLHGGGAPQLPQLSYSVLALGDTNYPKFCECGKGFDVRLESLGARRIHPRADCDVDFEENFRKWLDGVLGALNATGDKSREAAMAVQMAPAKPEPAAPVPAIEYSKRNPFPAVLVTNRSLNAPGSGKDTRHFEISLADSGLSYEVGDALGVIPVNCGELVEDIIRALGSTGEEAVPGNNGASVPLREALSRHYEITRISQPFLQAMAGRTGDETLGKLTAPGVNGELTRFLWGREIIDLLLAFPSARLTPVEFLGLLKKLQPRLYSISSSPKAHPGQVHLTVAVVRYDSLGRARKGVCSTFLADRVAPGNPVPVFVHNNKGFRPPTDGATPVIMVGPGTGIAPFRAFLEERRVVGAKGKNWLFFGDQHEKFDFLYRDELEGMARDGILNRMDTAFSRDQDQKVYVQNRMLENARELYAWLEDGAHFYVCGDASRMAKDVDLALTQVIATAGGKSTEEATAYVQNLKAAKHYQRDVY